MQIYMSTLSSSSENVCNDTRMMMDDWPLIAVHLFSETEVACPFDGGYDFDISLPSGEKVCSSTFLPLRLESSCVKGEGLLIRFRNNGCRQLAWNLRDENRLRCAAKWRIEGNDYVVVRNSDNHQYWCMRVEYDENKIIKKIYFFLDKICDTKARFLKERKYIIFKMRRHVVQSLCSDEFNGCRNPQQCKTKLKSHCLQSCGECKVNRDGSIHGLRACSFPKFMHGTWVRHVRSGTSKIVIRNNTVNINGEPNWHCISAGEGNYSRRHVLMKKFDNGCYPRFMCIELQETSPSVMRYRVGDIVLWPVNITYGLQEQVCNDNRFVQQYSNFSVSSSQGIIPLQNLVRDYDKRAVSCNLPAGLGTSLAFRGNKSRQGCLLHDIHFIPHKMVLMLEDDGGRYKTHGQYFCLASMKFIDEYDTIVTQTKDRIDEYLCWMIIDNKELIILPASMCNRVHAEAVIKRIEEPLARLSLISNNDCTEVEKRWRKMVVSSRNKHPLIEKYSSANQTRGLATVLFFMLLLALQ
ncbi:unnamed protein product [Acanthosepion pharaonis]|uniref:Uncharacterized protein n=1 Tax=Acanthosepion pharaonis TaxID=158019 RepID=A0A812D795_ACAPH|nr:unnamed protein product [Sepia pharaonis]